MGNRIAWGLALVLTAPAPAAGPGVTLDEPVEYPHAGIELAIPRDFQPQPLREPYDVASAVVREGERPVQSITLSAFPVAGGVTPEEFANAKMAELSRNLAIRDLKAIKTVPITVAALKGVARTMTYRFRRTASIAAQVYVIRELENAPRHICYLLTVVCATDRQTKLLPTLGAVIKSVRIVPLRHPTVGDPLAIGAPVEDYDLGFSVRRPAGWYAAEGPVGVEMGQTDYLLGGQPMPSAQLMVSKATGEETTAEACSRKYLALAESMAGQQKQRSKVVSHGPARMGPLEAHQFVLNQTGENSPAAPRKDNYLSSVVVVQRTACLPDPAGGAPKVFILILTAPGDQTKQATKAMNVLAEHFRPLTPATQPASAPATAPAADTQPAP